jgi:hypothetical protein
MQILRIALAATLVATAGMASATEITLGLGHGDKPDYARGGEDYLHSVSWYTGLVDVEMHAQEGTFGFLELPPDYDDDLPADANVAAYVQRIGECGNDDTCDPFVVTFSAPLDAAGVDFLGADNLSGADNKIFSTEFFLEAWSGPNGTGTLLARVTDPGPLLPAPVLDFVYPLSLTATVPGIRSIVFSAEALTEDYTSPVNLAILGSLRLTIVPEPASAALLALGLLLLGARRR